jgi:hypothetical protein
MGIDRPDDADVPSGEHSDRSADRADAPKDGTGGRVSRSDVEMPDREEHYAVLRAADADQDRTESVGGSEPRPLSRAEESADLRPAAVDREQAEPTRQSEPRAHTEAEEPTSPRAAAAIERRTEPAGRAEQGTHSKAGEPTENGQQPKAKASWEETAEKAVWMWGEYKRRWPPEERPQADSSKDAPGSWHGDGNRVLASPVNERIEAECDRIAEREEQILTPKVREVESQDPHRHLVGLEHCRKGRDRIKEKVCDNMRVPGVSPEQAVSFVPDAIRFTFQFEEARYTQGVLSDITRLENQGFKLEVSKNYWTDDQYKGINSQWIEPLTGQRFEVQFHTRISYEAKQLTHPAYERLRADPKPDEFEQMVLEAFQNRVTAEVPVPLGAVDIANYPERRKDAR